MPVATADPTVEVLSQTELERMEADALREMLIRKAAKERREQATAIKAALVEGGATFTSAELAARCSAALSMAVKGFKMRLRDAEWTEARSAVLAAALRVALAPAPIDRTTRTTDPAARWFLAPYGTPTSDRRHRLTTADVERMHLTGGHLPNADGATLAYCQTVARGVLAKMIAATAPCVDLSTADEVESPERWDAHLSGADLATLIGATARESLALSVAMDGTSPTEWAAEQGKTPKAGERAVAKGRTALCKRWPTATALRADLAELSGADLAATDGPWGVLAAHVNAQTTALANRREDVVTSAAAAGPIRRDIVLRMKFWRRRKMRVAARRDRMAGMLRQHRNAGRFCPGRPAPVDLLAVAKKRDALLTAAVEWLDLADKTGDQTDRLYGHMLTAAAARATSGNLATLPDPKRPSAC